MAAWSVGGSSGASTERASEPPGAGPAHTYWGWAADGTNSWPATRDEAAEWALLGTLNGK